MSVSLFQVDAFTTMPFHGNPAAVCILKQPVPDEWMQAVAAEMNLSETAFLQTIGDGFNLRWFTPRVEVDLCGHATLASAHILWETLVLQAHETARFHTRSGLLTATRSDAWITLDFPAKPLQATAPPPGLLEALGTSARFVGKNQFDYLVEVDHEEQVRQLQPDFSRLQAVDARGVMVTAASPGTEYDFVSRFFAPRVGVNEDPVTGSAHCCLAPYWAEKTGKLALRAYQASARGGELRLSCRGSRVLLSGQAITVLRGGLIEYA